MKVLWEKTHDGWDYRILLDVLGESNLRVEKRFCDLMGGDRWEEEKDAELTWFLLAVSLRNVTDELKERRLAEEQAEAMIHLFEKEHLMECRGCLELGKVKKVWGSDRYGDYCRKCTGEKWDGLA